MSFNVSYSHAAPFIRQRYLYALAEADSAQTVRDRNKALAKADGLLTALEILSVSEDTTMEPGIAQLDAIPRIGGQDAENYARDLLTRLGASPAEVEKVLGLLPQIPAVT